MIWYPEKEPNTQIIPFYNGRICAGFPSPAEPHLEQHLDLHTYLVHRPSSTFFTKATGDSMCGRGILDCAILVVDKSLTPRDGDIVIAVLSGELTVKELKLSPPRLVPGNKEFPELPIHKGSDFEIWGVVTAAINRYS